MEPALRGMGRRFDGPAGLVWSYEKEPIPSGLFIAGPARVCGLGGGVAQWECLWVRPCGELWWDCEFGEGGGRGGSFGVVGLLDGLR